jgi:hypothetical protein
VELSPLRLVAMSTITWLVAGMAQVQTALVVELAEQRVEQLR